MDFAQTKKLLCRLAAAYLLLAAMIFFVAGDGFKYERVNGQMLSNTAVIGEIVDGMKVEQPMTVNADHVEGINILTATFGRPNTGILRLRVLAEDGTELAAAQGRIDDMLDNQIVRFELPEPLSGQKNRKVTLEIQSEGCSPGNAVTIYYGSSVQAGKFNIEKNLSAEETYRIDGILGGGSLCAYFNGYNELLFHRIYWPVVLAIFLAGVVLLCAWWKQAMRGQSNPLTFISSFVFRYGFLMRQLVGRDFKTKYKRSFLGVGWSILNPLLTMTVQYIVFSKLFSNGTKNYPVYLLTGIVFFSFFNEAVNMGMTSIIANASLIKKVYMPKYIYPISRVLSSLINLGTSLLPLLAVMLLTGLLPRASMLLLVFDILCLVMFVTGMSLLLSTSMTFFQDTQFLWGVVSMIWMYLTPIFYMETIIPEKFLAIYKMNPMYQYITFARTCIIDGATPAPTSYLWCVLTAFVVLTLGIAVFRKNQNRFVLYL